MDNSYSCLDIELGLGLNTRTPLGLTIKQLVKEMGCHHEQLTDWMGGKIRPCERNLEKIGKFVEAF